MDREDFEDLVARAIAELPQQFRDRLDNIDVVVENWPTRSQLRGAGIRGGFTISGLYEGVPLTRRGQGYGLVPPDKITIFQGPIQSRCHTNEEMIKEVRRVVRHEIAHHFGMDEATLREIEGGE